MSKRLLLSFLILISLPAFFTLHGQQTIEATTEPVRCFGESNGIIRVSVTGGLAPYYYSYTGPNGLGSEWSDDTFFEFTGVASGPYTVSVWDATLDQAANQNVTVRQPALITVDINPNPADICPLSGRELEGNPSGGNDDQPYVIHQWTGSGAAYLNNSGIENPIFNSGDIGSYGLTYRVEDYKGCFAEESISIEVFEAISGGFSIVDVTCFGGANGSVSLDWAMGGSGNYQYNIGGSEWKSDDEVFEGLPAGSYEVRIRDFLYPDDCEVMIGTAVVGQPEVLTASITHTDVTCYGGNNGTITISGATGGSNTYEYRVSGVGYNPGWQPGSLFEGLTSGDYVVEIRDAADTECVMLLDGSFTVGEPEVLTASLSHTDVTCFGGANGTITISGATGGSNTYEYRVSGVGYNPGWQSGSLFEGLTSGDYVVEIRDAADPSCVVILNGSYPVSEPDELTGTVYHSDVTGCHGDTNGWIEIFADGSWAAVSGNYEYTIDGGATWSSTNMFSNLPAGIYDVQVRDADNPGCSFVIDANLEIVEPDPITADFFVDPVSCFGGSDGEIRFDNVAGGTPPYQFSINGGDGWQYVNPVFTGLVAGTYELEIRNGSNPRCPTYIGTAVVTRPDELIISSVAGSDVDCHGGTSGSITVTASGGTGTILYSVNDVDYLDNGGVFTGLAAGIYEVSVMDDNNCVTDWGAFEIDQPDPLYGEVSSSDVLCNGANNGEISVINVSGGSGDYEYRLDGGAWSGTGNFSGLAPATYQVWMRDSNATGCFVEVDGSPLTISEPAVLEIATDVDDVDCHGSLTGSIEITANGGNGGYEYRLDSGVWQAGNVFTGLAAGDYLVEVRDMNGCFVDELVTVAEPDPLIFKEVNSLDETCFGANDGVIEIFADGGTTPYRYSVDGGITFSDNRYFDNLLPGDYLVLVEDAAGCTWTFFDQYGGDAYIDHADEIVINSLTVADISCFGAADGEISVTASGGNGGIRYRLFEAGTTTDPDTPSWGASGDFSGLDAGAYILEIRDSRYCIISLEIEIIEPGLVVLTAWHDDISCHNAGDGVVYASVEGGVEDFMFILYDADTDSEIMNSGLLSSRSHEFTGLDAGNYYVMVVDGNGCGTSASDPMVVLNPEKIEINLLSYTGLICYGADEGIIEVDATGGTGVYTYTLLDGDSVPVAGIDPVVTEDDALFTDLAAGSYIVEIADVNGCTDETVGIQIERYPEPAFGSFTLTHITCFGYEEGIIEVEAFGGTGAYTYTLLDSLMDPIDGYDPVTPAGEVVFAGLAAASYYISVTDEGGCAAVISDEQIITQPEGMDVEITREHISCHGLGDGRITITTYGGTGPFEYSIDSGMTFQVSNIFEDLGEGDYVIVVADANNCELNAGTVSVNEPDPVEIVSITKGDDERCTADDPHTGYIIISAAGGTGTLEYSIDGASTFDANGGIFENLERGDYDIVVRDVNDCSVVGDRVVIEGNDPIDIIHLIKDDIKCFGTENGGISISASGGSGTLEYSVDEGVNFSENGNFTGLTAGDYIVIVKDEAGCMVTVDTIEILQPPLLEFDSVTEEDIIIGSGIEYGSITIVMAGGVEPYSYSIDDGNTWQDENYFGNLPVDDYKIRVIDNNGCLAVTTAHIREVTGITADILTFDPACSGYEDGVITIMADLGEEPYEYSIDGGTEYQTAGNFTGLPAGAYELVVRDNRGYIFSETVTLDDPEPITAVVDVTRTWCNVFSADGAIGLDVTGGTGDYSYFWSNGATTRDVGDLEPGQYQVVISDDNSCEASLTIEVRHEHTVEVSLPDVVTICYGESVELVSSVNQSGSSATYSWEASAGDDPGFVTVPSVSPSEPTTYTLTVTDENSCYNMAEVLVDMHPVEGIFIGNDTVIYQGSSIDLVARGGEFVSYEWAPGAGLSDLSGPETTATVTNPITYVVFAETAQGCIESDSIFIDIAMPVEPVSGFTPNGDGVNDFFDVVHAADYPDIVVEVFNRSGQRIFHSVGYSDDKRWDGTFNGRELPVGTYYFVITLNDPFGTRPVTGPITIVR